MKKGEFYIAKRAPLIKGLFYRKVRGFLFELEGIQFGLTFRKQVVNCKFWAVYDIATGLKVSGLYEYRSSALEDVRNNIENIKSLRQKSRYNRFVERLNNAKEEAVKRKRQKNENNQEGY